MRCSNARSYFSEIFNVGSNIMYICTFVYSSARAPDHPPVLYTRPHTHMPEPQRMHDHNIVGGLRSHAQGLRHDSEPMHDEPSRSEAVLRYERRECHLRVHHLGPQTITTEL